MDPKLSEILSNVFDMRTSDINASLEQKDIIKWDSLTHMDLITNIEREYDIQLSMEHISEMKSICRIISILRNYGINIHA